MHFFRMRLILALIAGVTLVSVASTYFEVLAHRHMLRRDLERRTAQKASSLVPEMELAFTGSPTAKLAGRPRNCVPAKLRSALASMTCREGF